MTSQCPCLSLVRAAVFTTAAFPLHSAWIVPKDISRLQQHEIQAYINEPFKRSADLLQGYRIALNPTKWEEEREAARVQAEENEANAEIDQLESDAELDGEDEDLDADPDQEAAGEWTGSEDLPNETSEDEVSAY